jgi:hypothetical protein
MRSKAERMANIERQVWREAPAMTRREVITKAITKQLRWVQASEILGISALHMGRLRGDIAQVGISSADHAGFRFKSAWPIDGLA